MTDFSCQRPSVFVQFYAGNAIPADWMSIAKNPPEITNESNYPMLNQRPIIIFFLFFLPYDLISLFQHQLT